MNTATGTAVHHPKRWVVWVGRVLSAIPVLMILMSAAMKFMRPPQVVDAFVHQFGYPENELLILGVLELTSAVLYAIPRIAFLAPSWSRGIWRRDRNPRAHRGPGFCRSALAGYPRLGRSLSAR